MFHSAHPYLHFLRLWLTVLALFAAWPTHAVSTFTDHGDGTVSDSATGLMWDKCSWGQTSSDLTCATGSATTHTWAAALGVSVTANAANYKGHNDWRLPNRLELESLVKIAAYSPAIDPAFSNTQSNAYWSATIYTPDPAGAWHVYFGDGYTNADYQSDGDHVRLVRSGQSFDTFDALAPAVTAISPISGSILGGTTVTISGSLFTGATGVTIGGVAVTGLIVVNDTTITATTPAGTAGAQNVVVTAHEGVGTGVSLFTYSAYTKIANDGSELADSALLGSLAADWACTRDNATGLLWEVKTTSGTRSQDNRYTNYDDLTQAEFWSGSAYRNPTQAEIDAAGNSIGFVNAVNTGALCGFRDWKMSSQDELLALYPKINANTSFFLNTLPSHFWSGTPYTPDPANAWVVNFGGGYSSANYQSDSVLVRLVRSGQSLGTFTLTLSASGTGSGNLASSVGGLNCTSTAGTTVGTCTTSPGLAEGTSVNLTATTAAGSTFTGWSGACSGTTSPCTVIMAALKSVTANFSINNYTVSFNSNGGSAVAGQTIAYNGTATAPTTPTQTGSSFADWYSDIALTTSFSFATLITADTPLYAKWTVNNYTVSFNPNGGSTVTSQTIAYNGTASAPTVPTKTGSTFVGWYSDIALTSSFSFATLITADTPLYAKWTVNNYTVSFNPNGGSGTMSTQSANVATNLTANSFTRSGYTFSGWKTGTGGTGTSYANNASYAFAANATLYAQWMAIPIPPDTYSVTYSGNGSTGGSVPIDGNSYAYSTSVTVLGSGSLTKTGATFVGWNTAATGNGTAYAAAATFNIGSSAVTLYAKWMINSYSITASASPTIGGSVICSPNPVNYNASSTCTATPATGYAFTGWSGDCSGITTSPCTLSQVMTNKSVTGTFKGISVVILSASPAAQALSGQTTTLTAQVSGVAGMPGGSISFLNGTNLLGSATLDGSGGAIFASNLPIGTHSLLARYAGNTAYLAGQSSALSYLVASKLPTTVRISTAPNLSQIGDSVAVRVTASAVPPTNPAAGEVSGTVEVSGDGQTCSFTLPGSSCEIIFNSNGRKSLSATYSGNNSYSPSSGSSVHFVGKRPSISSPLLLLLD